jgi:predicted nucleic acid-binding protein
VNFVIDASVWVSAFEAGDEFHEPSVRLLREVELKQARVCAPLIVILEVACAIARRNQYADVANAIDTQFRSHPQLFLRAIDDELLDCARVMGTQRFLRAADSLYLATATLEGSTLVAWDKELILRADAITPTQALQQLRPEGA